jgi:DNA-binding transcriptional ArsR family regulator
MRARRSKFDQNFLRDEAGREIFRPFLTPPGHATIFNHMVERELYLNNIFGSLADPIRRDMLQRLISAQYTVSQLAANYSVSLAAVAKHLKVLESASLIVKHRRGKEQVVSIAPEALEDASKYISQYEALWNRRLDALDELLKES